MAVKVKFAADEQTGRIVSDIRKKINLEFHEGTLSYDINEITYANNTRNVTLNMWFVDSSDQQVYTQSFGDSQLYPIFGGKCCVKDIEVCISLPRLIIPLDTSCVLVIGKQNALTLEYIVLPKVVNSRPGDK